MILFFPVILKELFEKGRSYPWSRPRKCPKCGAPVVRGHGFVTAIFDGFNQPLFLKRYRCPDCRCVMRVRPCGYFPRFQSPIGVIRHSMAGKEEKGRWLTGLPRTRQAHWWRALKRRIAAFFGHGFLGTKAQGFDRLQAQGKVPVSRAI
jgi:hypothetical protein